ncbi:MAG: hypothetical protein WAQ98_12925 [Blastocatellia bacterium]
MKKKCLLFIVLILVALAQVFASEDKKFGYKINPTFEKILQKNQISYDIKDKIAMRILADYGAVFTAQNQAIVPPYIIFPDAETVNKWQASVKSEKKILSGISIELQSAAMKALLSAQATAKESKLTISPNGSTAAARSYEDTAKLWRSRVDPGLSFHLRQKHISASEVETIRKLSPKDQIPEILKLEAKGFYFSKSLDKSILYSVAAVGTSQHISLLALDVKEHNNQQVRTILAQHGWFQTVVSDQPHFTYLGVTEDKLPSLGLKKVANGGRIYWLPDIEVITK